MLYFNKNISNDLMTQPSGQLRNMTFNQTFESSLVEKNNEKFTVDKSLIKGIKENDVSKIIDQNQVSGGAQNKDLFDQLKEVEGVVIDTRKRFDKTKSLSLASEQEIQKLKGQKEILLEDQAKYNAIIDKQRRQLQSTTHRLEEMTNLMQATIFRKDIYNNMKDVVKHDLLVLKKRYFDKDVLLMRENTKLKTLRTQHDSKMKLSKRCREMLDSVQKSVHVKQIQRTSKIQSFCDVISRKQANDQNREIRERQIKQAMISAMTDKLAQEKQWMKMMDANLFLKGVLKAKMQRLMGRYNQIELSFHKMKQATSLKDSNQFIERFLTREETYGMLLQSIAQKQRMLEQLKQERDQLQKIHANYLYKSEEITDKKNEPKQNKLQATNPSNQLHEVSEHIISISRKKQMMYQWATKFLASHLGMAKRDQIAKKFPKNKTKQLILQVLLTLKKTINDIQVQQNSSRKIEDAFLKNNPKETIMTDEMFEKNTRIKTLSTYENENETFEDKDMAYDDLSEADYIQYNRRAIKKNDIQNRKFRIKTKPN